MTPSIAFLTFGCKVNQYESDWMARQLEKDYSIANPHSDYPALFVVNTCTVTAEADRKNFQAIHRVKRCYPAAKVLVTGCHSQMDPEKYGGVADGVVGNGEKGEILAYVKRTLSEGPFTNVNSAYWLRSSLSMSLEGRFGLSRAFILIQDGCATGCSYCKIFHARGSRGRSKPVEDVLSEIRAFSDNGYREIVLLGINIGQYRDQNERLVTLLERVLTTFPDLRFRLSSLNPEYLVPELIALWRFPNLCKHLHLSVQSGSYSVLQRMRRPYAASIILDAVAALRRTDPLFSFTADVIVGFPGESDRDFEETCALIQMIEPLKVHIFRFSPRKNTPAAVLPEKVEETEKKRRSRALFLLSEKLSEKYREKHIRHAREVIVEVTDTKSDFCNGHDEFYIRHTINRKDGITAGFITGTKVWVNPESIDRDHIDGMVSSHVRVSE